jgi:two-component system, cell cycle sensor histidine kinase and response regulator CckA
MIADRQYRILVVDDEDAVLRVVDRVLRDAGYNTATAHDSDAAIKLMATNPSFDLLLTDLVMPGITGDELARYLRRTDPDLKVLYLTAFADRLFTDRRVLWQNESFIEKPVTSAALGEAVSLALFGHAHGPEMNSPKEP